MAAAIREGRIELEGIGAPLLEAGPEDAGEAVVFVHGNPGSAEDWRRLLEGVGGFGRGIAFDMPGFGRADKPRDFDYTSEGYGKYIARALDQLGVRRVHLVVHDFGGPFGWAWVAERGDALASLVIFNTGLMTQRRWHTWARRWRTPVLGEVAMASVTRPVFRRTLRQKVRQLPPQFVDRMYDDFDWGTKRAVLKLYRATDLPYPPAAGWVARLRELAPPTLIVWGPRDPYLAGRTVEEFREVFPRGELIMLDDSGHWPFADDPDSVEAAVIPFLRRQLAGATA
jgi:pimeloyl-ACP methyl ester carboxylesterase